MITSVNIQLIFHYVMIILYEGFSETKAQVHHGNHGNQTRDIYYTTTFDQDISRRSRSSTELPVAFRAPDVESQNFWNYNPQGGPDRRTFFEDLKYLNYGKSNVFPNLNSFFEFMSPLFDRERTVKPRQQPISKPSEPYKYEYPFTYPSSTERNFLPPPKPLRASIVKLETVTKVPDWQVPFRYVPRKVHLSQPSNYQSQPTEKLPSLFIDELGFHSDHNINFRRDSDWLPQRTPGEFSTIASFDAVEPTDPPQISTELDFNVKSTTTIRQESVKNDNRPSNYASTPAITEHITEVDGNFFGESEDVTSTVTDDTPTQEKIKQDDEVGSKKTLQLVITNTANKYNMINNLKINRDVNNNTVTENTEGSEPVESVKPYKGNTIKIVTDLTLEGLQKNKKSAVNVPRYTKFLNMSNLISYELNKLKQNKLMKQRSNFVEKRGKESSINAGGFVNNNDELSLDLKILKDTNWDGFTTESDNYSPTAAQIDAETKQWITEGRNLPSNHNNSISNSAENKENINNQTIIVETRVTKSVSKLLPGKNRINRQKYYRIKGGRDPRNEVDLPKKVDNAVGIQQPNLKVPEGEEINTTDLPLTTTEENEKVRSEEKEQIFNKTVITLGKKFEVFQENSTGDNETSADVSLNYRNRRRKYKPLSRNKTYNYSVNTIDTTPLPATVTNKQKDESLNSTIASHIERTRDGETSAANEDPQPKNIDNVVGTQMRRKKPKRTSKSKRRRTGKRRKPSTVTEKQVTTEESTHISIPLSMISNL